MSAQPEHPRNPRSRDRAGGTLRTDGSAIRSLVAVALGHEEQGAMTNADQEQQLLHKLRVSLADNARGFTAEAGGPSGVVILNKGHYRGVWHWMEGGYTFTPGGYANSTHSAPTPQDAIRFTLDHVCRQ